MNTCQACGSKGRHVQIWQECNEMGNPIGGLQLEYVFVALCKDCARKIIPDQVRKYEPWIENRPYPGIVPMCAECKFHNEMVCSTPRLRRLGGQGFLIRHQLPHDIYPDGANGRPMQVFPQPAYTCTAFEMRAREIDQERSTEQERMFDTVVKEELTNA